MPSSNLTARMQFDQGTAAVKREDYNAASEHFRMAVDLDVSFVEAHQQLAEAYERLGYAHRAKKAWGALQRIAKDPALVSLCDQRIKSL